MSNLIHARSLMDTLISHKHQRYADNISYVVLLLCVNTCELS